MNNLIDLAPLTAIIIGLAIIALALWGIVLLTAHISVHRLRAQVRRRGLLLLATFLQILLGAGVIALLRILEFGPYAGIALGLAAAIVAGLPLLRLAHAGPWTETLKVWGLAAALQAVLLPVVGFILVFALMLLMLWLYPPVY